MTKIFCIVGTDTEMGKTYASCQLLRYLSRQGLNVTALKPIASGLSDSPQGLINDDVFKLAEASSETLTFEQRNAFAFKEPIAPHIAANREGIDLTVQRVHCATQATIKSCRADVVLIEGVGGIMTPLNETETYVDLLAVWQYPIVLIVGMKLGCLNHAMLTVNALAKLNLVGWIANCLEPTMMAYQDNLAYLTANLPVPLLSVIPYQGTLQVTNAFNRVFL